MQTTVCCKYLLLL